MATQPENQTTAPEAPIATNKPSKLLPKLLTAAALTFTAQYAALLLLHEKPGTPKDSDIVFEPLPGIMGITAHTQHKNFTEILRSLAEPASISMHIPHPQMKLIPGFPVSMQQTIYNMPMSYARDFAHSSMQMPEKQQQILKDLIYDITHTETNSRLNLSIHNPQKTLNTLASHPILPEPAQVTIEGYSSVEGSDFLGMQSEQNADLSSKRAEVVNEALQKEFHEHHIENMLVAMEGKGEVPLSKEDIRNLAALVEAPADIYNKTFQRRVYALAQDYNEGKTLAPYTKALLDSIIGGNRKVVIHIETEGGVSDMTIGLPLMLLICLGWLLRNTKEEKENLRSMRRKEAVRPSPRRPDPMPIPIPSRRTPPQL